MGEVRRSYPRFKRDGPGPRIELTDDDWNILRRVFRYRFIRTEDFYRLFPERSADRLSRRLAHLYRAGLLDRPLSQIDYFRGGGSQSLVYGLDTAGARVLMQRDGASVGSGDWKARNRAFTRDNLDHTLAVTRFLVDLELSCRARSDLSLITAEEILAGAPEKTRRRPGPVRWPVTVRYEDQTGTVMIAPDAIFGLRTTRPDGRSARSFVFLEIDRGTMTIAPAKQVRESQAFLHRSTILRKLLTYAESYRQELHKEHLGIPVARVLMVTTSVTRAEAMRRATERFIVKPSRLPPGLFLFGVQQQRANLSTLEWTDALGQPVQMDGGSN